MTAGLTFIVTAAFGLLLLGGFQIEQLIAATIGGVIAVVWSVIVRRVNDTPLRLSTEHLSPWLRAIGRLPVDTLKVGGVLARTAAIGGSPGRAVRRPFRFGSRDDAAERGRRATAVLAGSLTPDAIVVDAAPGDDDALVHRMVGGERPTDSEWLA